jgi:hypothetical protein
VTRSELIELARKIIDVDGTQQERNRWIAQFNRSVPHPAGSDLIFYPKGNRVVTPEEVVDEALAYVPKSSAKPGSDPDT